MQGLLVKQVIPLLLLSAGVWKTVGRREQSGIHLGGAEETRGQTSTQRSRSEEQRKQRESPEFGFSIMAILAVVAILAISRYGGSRMAITISPISEEWFGQLPIAICQPPLFHHPRKSAVSFGFSIMAILAVMAILAISRHGGSPMAITISLISEEIPCTVVPG